jgi:hypothetical protein
MNGMNYVLVNKSSAAEVTPGALEQARCDLESAHNTIFAPLWGVLPVDLHVGMPETDARTIELVDTLDDASALAYHTVDSAGNPMLRVGLGALRSSLGAGETLLDALTKAISHELFEASRNPFVAFFCFVAHADAMLAVEVCDPVQGGSFKHGASAISNFVLPAYFDAEDLDGPFDYAGELVAPLSCAANGYQAWSDGTQTLGDELPEHVRAHVVKHGRVAVALSAKVAA